MINKLNVLIFSFVITLTLATSPSAFSTKRSLEEDRYSALSFCNNLPVEVGAILVKEAAISQALDYNLPGNLACVSKEWNKVIDDLKQEVKTPVWKLLQGVANEQDEATYQAFLNGKLVYRPNSDSDDGKIEFNISDFLNPFKGTFNISRCGDTPQYLTITTDPSAFFHINKEQTPYHILIAPHFLIKNYIASLTKPFEPIMQNWNAANAPVGIFWRWSGYDDLSWYAYLSSSSLVEVCSKSLYKNWLAAQREDMRSHGAAFWNDFHVYF